MSKKIEGNRCLWFSSKKETLSVKSIETANGSSKVTTCYSKKMDPIEKRKWMLLAVALLFYCSLAVIGIGLVGYLAHLKILPAFFDKLGALGSRKLISMMIGGVVGAVAFTYLFFFVNKPVCANQAKNVEQQRLKDLEK